MGTLALVLVALLVLALSRLWHLVVVHLTWRPYAMARKLRAQGLHGPPYKFLKGSNEDIRRMKKEADGLVLDDVHCHDYLPRVFPHWIKWRAQYGQPIVHWYGAKPRICVVDYELVKQILANKSGHFVKNDPHPTVLAMIGKGLVLVEGTDWVRHRRVVNPALTMDKLKMMTSTMMGCAQSLIKQWEDQARQSEKQQAEVEFSEQFQQLTADVISHTAFGSSFREGKQVFQAQKELLATAISSFLNVQLPGLNYLPTEKNRRKWRLEKEMRSVLLQIIQSRLAAEDGGYGNDLLGLMLEACVTAEPGKLSLGMDEIIDECKTFFFAGHETTSHLLTWTMFLLGAYPEWQERLREEVLRECGKGVPDADMLSKLKELTMVLYETLRLYGPVLAVLRKPTTDMALGSLTIPKGVGIVIPVAMMHRDKEVWGDDADEFNPLRFENGVTRAAKHPHALLSFSMGPRSCIGQNFAMLEAKSVMAMILQKFSFTVSPNYVHAPADFLALRPKFGLPMLVRPLGG